MWDDLLYHVATRTAESPITQMHNAGRLLSGEGNDIRASSICACCDDGVEHGRLYVLSFERARAPFVL